MKRLLIVGASGMGRETAEYAKACFPCTSWTHGFLDNRPELLDGLSNVMPPIVGTVEDFEIRERVYTELKKANVFTRRYFYPLLSDFDLYRNTRGRPPVARRASGRMLTLPTYHGLDPKDARDVARSVLELI